MNLWCKSSIEDLHRCKYVLGPFDGLNSDLIQKLLNILCEKKQLKMSHLHVLLHSNVKHLDLSVCSSLVTDQILSPVGCRCKKLTYLSLKNCSRLSTKALKEISINLPCLQLIDLSGCQACTDDVLNLLGASCPELRWLRGESCFLISDAGIDGLCGDDDNPRCRRLREVTLTSTAITSYGMQKLLISQPELKKLSLAMTIHVIGEKFRLNTRSLPEGLKLKSVDLSNTAITNASIKNLCEICPWLCELSLNCCSSVTAVSLQYIASLTLLKAFSIADNEAIKFRPHLAQFLAKSGNSLQALNISAMENVETQLLCVCCKSLKSLIMADCREITASYIHFDQERNSLSLAQACPKLNILDLHNCHFTEHNTLADHLSAILSSSTELQELDLSGIEYLSDEIIIQFIQSSDLSKLRSVNLSRCSEISMEPVELLVETCQGLTQLNLSHCQNISLRDAESLRKISRHRRVKANITWV
ncbi:hypothetical protein ACROYT_G004259 [Oculina patagonica]